ncbi:MAG: HDOD domain-containing protein [Planctomycetota bacterium]|nr:MAG: HDOD domain-containing protein [Planctomycetota bacterium]
MKRILFVDDEQPILDGLQNLLRKQRNEWQMVFALGSQRGLEELAKAPFDVVVSDMRMPGMDGAAFLARVRDLHPATARVVLSGHAEPQLLMRVIPVAHQFLSKPCDAALLKAVVERTCALQQHLGNAAIRTLVGKVDTLPSVPEIYQRLTAVLHAPGAGVPEVADVIEQDPAMSLKLLQLVNSAFFGLPLRIGTVRQAVGYLGTELIEGLVLTAHIFTSERSQGADALSYRRLQESSLLTAKLARSFLGKRPCAGDAFTAGLLRDIGSAVLLRCLPGEYEQIRALAAQRGVAPHVVEREVLGVTHAEIGAYLLGMWGLPFETMEIVCHHHTPSRAVGGKLEVLAAVHAADVLAERAFERGERALEPALDLAFLERSGCAGELPAWREQARCAIQEAA